MSFSLSDLETADRHVALAEKHVLNQEELLSTLRMRGADTKLAEELLTEFNVSLKIHRHDRDHIAAELGRAS